MNPSAYLQIFRAIILYQGCNYKSTVKSSLSFPVITVVGRYTFILKGELHFTFLNTREGLVKKLQQDPDFSHLQGK